MIFARAERMSDECARRVQNAPDPIFSAATMLLVHAHVTQLSPSAWQRLIINFHPTHPYARDVCEYRCHRDPCILGLHINPNRFAYAAAHVNVHGVARSER